MTRRLTDDELQRLRVRAKAEGTSMQKAARRAVPDDLPHGQHRDRVVTAATRVMETHAHRARPPGAVTEEPPSARQLDGYWLNQ